ncbi:MAG: invasion associated locus B family protein [Bosea sp. (in: a-proteobacteria)]|uniref:invasion associated locus B family protein n=1 Tax=Bosea sp. (in: a-proteobacteria) TaxID=1871050 RepID=UPI003F7BA086
MARRSLQTWPLVVGRIAPVVALLALGLDGAQAQPAGTKPAARPPVSAEPTMTTASFGDWVLRCQKLPQNTAGRVCEVAQTMQIQGQSAPVAQFAIGRASKTEPLRATAVVPPNVSFPSNVQVALEKDSSPLELDWRRCVPGACLADLVLKEDQLKRWRAASENGRLVFKDATGREIAIALSFLGLGPALDALAKETF